MQLYYGNYGHALGVPAITISREVVNDAGERPYIERERWQINGLLPNPDGSATTLKAAIDELVAAYSVNGYNLILYMPDGSTPSSHALYSSSCFGGTRVVQRPSFPTGTGPEGVTYRNFSLAVEGDISLISPGTSYTTSFTETLEFNGGGFLDGHLEPLVGQPIKQRRKQNTTYRATQQGEAVGLFGYPPVPPPIWPAALTQPNPKFTLSSPRRRQGTFVDYRINWLYEYESARPIIGTPNTWRE